MAKLVAYYSRADENYFSGSYKYVKVGNTEKVAKAIADMINGELFKIEQEKPYSKDYKECVEEAKRDKQQNARPKLSALPKSIDGYDEIYLGYPNYCGTMPMAVYTFLEAFDWSGKTIYPFCTHEGSGMSGTEQDISNAAKGSNVKVEKGLAVFGGDADNAAASVSLWLKR